MILVLKLIVQCNAIQRKTLVPYKKIAFRQVIGKKPLEYFICGILIYGILIAVPSQ